MTQSPSACLTRFLYRGRTNALAVAIVMAMLCVLFSVNSHANDACFEDWFCVNLVKNNKHYDVVVNAIRPHPVVVTVDGPLEKGTRHSQVTLQLPEKSNTVIGQVNDRQQFWNRMRARWTGGVLHAKHNNEARYRFPVKPRHKYRIVQGFNGGFSHRGAERYAIDIAMPVGTPVYAAREGTVISTESKNTLGGASRQYASYANYIIILHKDGTTGEYFHLKHKGVVVEVGEAVTQGQLIGYSGNTGFSSLAHLHFGVYYAKANGQYQTIRFILDN